MLRLLSCALFALACEHRPDARKGDDRSPIQPRSATNEIVFASERRLFDHEIDWNANKVMRVLGHMSETLASTKYSHGFRVNERQGIYEFDCSGMTQWVLRKAAPRAAAASAWGLEHRPLARDYQRRIASIAPDKPRHGWRRVERVADALPGDVVAWLKPDIIESKNTGHVAFIVLPPVPVPDQDHAYLVRIADSTSLLHDEDTRLGRTGFGMGTILLIADPETGSPLAYGWVGLRWRAFETKIAIGRPLN